MTNLNPDASEILALRSEVAKLQAELEAAQKKKRQTKAGAVGDRWRTPEELLVPVRVFSSLLGFGPQIALDPCGGPGSLVNARVELSLENGDDGLAADWGALVPEGGAYINPPFSNPRPWIAKSAAFGKLPGRHAIVLVNAQTSDGWWPNPWPPAVCFWKGRIKFLTNGQTYHSNTRPNALLYWGDAPELFEHVFKAKGKVVRS